MSSRACWLAQRRMRSRSPVRFSSLTWVSCVVGEADVDEADGLPASGPVPGPGPAMPVMPMPTRGPVRWRMPSARARATLRTDRAFALR